jgi:putative ABC transport system substrate-binding protein
MAVIGVLVGTSPGPSRANVAGFRQGLRQAGYIEGQNIHIAFRWAEGRYERLSEMATELVDLQPHAIVAFGPAPTRAAIAASSTIPVVFALSADPVTLGFVASLNRPGGNATGLTFLGSELVAKQFEILHELLPAPAAIGLLVNPTSPAIESHLRDIPVVTRRLGLRVGRQNASREQDLDAAFAGFALERVVGVVVPSDPFFYGRREQLTALAAHHGLPAIYADREYVADGGLMSYGASITNAYRHAALFAARILKGDKPADLPVEQAVKIELIANLRTATALGLTIPPTLLARADEVIE